MLRQNGGCNVVVVAPAGLKMDLAQKLGAGDKYVEVGPAPKISTDEPIFGAILSRPWAAQEAGSRRVASTVQHIKSVRALESDFRSSLSAGRVFKIKNLSDVDALQPPFWRNI
jgi:hypothetical protein